jgi:multidrug resistance protein MdtO
MLTCVIVALTSAGATIHKATLRLVGCAIGGALALASIVFVVPHMTSIAGLILLVAAVTALAGWIAMGSERTAYAGIQLAFAFYLCTLQGYAPSTDVTEFRDRFVGIVLGVVVMSLVFTYVWPERAASGVVKSLAAALRRMAEFARGSGDARASRAAAWQALAGAERLAELSAFEPDAPDDRVRGLMSLARRTLLLQGALVEPAGSAVAEALDAVANRLQTGAPLAAPLAAPERGDQATLREALADRVDALQRTAAPA